MAFEKGRVDVGWCVVESRKKSDKLRVKVRLGPSSPKPMTGYGGWTLRARPKERALTTWEGTEPLRVQIDLMFDEFISRDAGDLETDIKALERMAGLTRDGESPPPLLRWEANAPHDWRERPNYDWVIENLEFGEGLYNDWGDRLRQQVTVTFLEHVDEDYTTLTPSQRHRAEQKRNRTSVAPRPTTIVAVVVAARLTRSWRATR
jgi:hypothetical protein